MSVTTGTNIVGHSNFKLMQACKCTAVHVLASAGAWDQDLDLNRLAGLDIIFATLSMAVVRSPGIIS